MSTIRQLAEELKLATEEKDDTVDRYERAGAAVKIAVAAEKKVEDDLDKIETRVHGLSRQLQKMTGGYDSFWLDGKLYRLDEGLVEQKVYDIGGES